MNERIKLFAEQAGITTNIDTEYFEKDFNKWLDYFSEKFAELIIKECTDICQQQEYDYWRSPYDQEFTPIDCADAIKEHFGVEE